MSAMASQITVILIVCSIVCSGTDQRKHQSAASLAFVRGIHRWPVESPHKGPITREMFPFNNVIVYLYFEREWWRKEESAPWFTAFIQWSSMILRVWWPLCLQHTEHHSHTYIFHYQYLQGEIELSTTITICTCSINFETVNGPVRISSPNVFSMRNLRTKSSFKNIKVLDPHWIWAWANNNLTWTLRQWPIINTPCLNFSRLSVPRPKVAHRFTQVANWMEYFFFKIVFCFQRSITALIMIYWPIYIWLWGRSGIYWDWS